MTSVKADIMEWIDFDAPSPDEPEETVRWSVHANFLLSNWNCIYGKGCPGMFGVQSSNIFPDIGCCTKGAWFSDQDDFAHVTKQVARLTDDDWDAELRKKAEEHGWSVNYQLGKDAAPTEISARTRVVDGGCIFSNRANGSVGRHNRTGCAFVHLAIREDNGEHIATMPNVCWQLPLYLEVIDDTWTLRQWGKLEWGGYDEDGDQENFMHWWCSEAPEAYTAKNAVYVTMECELRKMMGAPAYETMAALLDERRQNVVASIVPPDARTLPMYIGNRTPKRVAP